MTGDEAYREAAAHVRLTLANQQGVQHSDIEKAVRAALLSIEAFHGRAVASLVDGVALAREIESETAIWQPDFSSLDDADDHQDWLIEQRGEIDWRFWSRYRLYLLDSGLPPQVVRKLDESTDKILGSLESPRREGSWDRRGLVVGHVQAGKTGNYTGLICKAIDAGYRLIVVLAGLHESLRCQTQERIEEGVLGHDARHARASEDVQAARHRVGVGAAAGRYLLPVHSFTSRDGDFTADIAAKIGPLTGGDPVVLVVKKNKSVLQNLIAWCRTAGFADPETGRWFVPDLPLLIIDDEADNASVNTKAAESETLDDGTSVEADPTAINQAIRELLRLHDKSAYVGYTATPFANIFIYEDADHSQFGDDLFPRSFIVRLPPPDNYVGPAKVFGLAASDEAQDAESVEPLGIVCSVGDADGFVLDPKRKDSGIGPLPQSLVRAVHSFVIAGAVRRARGQVTQHNSMLVHVTRFVMVQERVAEALDELVGSMRDRVRYGDGAGAVPIRDELRALWEEDFEPTWKRLADRDRGANVAWSEVELHLTDFLERVTVYKVNGTARDALQYRDHDGDGLAVIAVGGDKLSRGLTLEGLTTSYYLRTSRMYDTLMQMGRWFGYRTGYLDVCRLYTTPELQRWYSHITMANEELNRRFDEMASQGRNPKEFGLLVRTHPDGLLVTARTKMRNAHSMKLDFSGSCPETTAFDFDPSVHLDNGAEVERLLQQLSRGGGGPIAAPKRDGAVWLWPQATGEEVARFLEAFQFSASAYRVNGRLMSRFIQSAIERGELTSWTVAVAGRRVEKAPKTFEIGGIEIGGIVRDARKAFPEVGGFSMKSITSGPDETVDLSAREFEDALQLTRGRLDSGDLKRKSGIKGGPDGIAARRVRPRSRGLLLLYPIVPQVENRPEISVDLDDRHPLFGVAVSFPFTRETPGVDYRVNNVFWTTEQA